MLNRLRFSLAGLITDRSTAKIEHTPQNSTHIYTGKTVIHKRYGIGTVLKTFHCRSTPYVLVAFKSTNLNVAANTLKPW